MLGYPAGDLDQEEIQRRENHQSSTGGGRRHHGPGCLPETPGHRTDFVSLAEQIRQHDGVGSSASEGVGILLSHFESNSSLYATLRETVGSKLSYKIIVVQ